MPFMPFFARAHVMLPELWASRHRPWITLPNSIVCLVPFWIRQDRGCPCFKRKGSIRIAEADCSRGWHCHGAFFCLVVGCYKHVGTMVTGTACPTQDASRRVQSLGTQSLSKCIRRRFLVPTSCG